MNDFVPATNDVMFKALFATHLDLLKGFLNDVVGLSIENDEDITVLNPDITPELISGKFVRLDLNIRTGEEKINVEMQSYNDEHFDKRTLFYWAKMFTEDLKKGEDYSLLKRSISVNLLNVNRFDGSDYLSEFIIMEKNRHTQLTDLFSMQFYELQKIPSIDKSCASDDNRLLWLQLIKANQKEMLDMLQQSGNTLIQKGVDTLYHLNADDELREKIRVREKRDRDEASALNTARREGKAELKNDLISQWRKKGYSEEEIQKLLEGV